MRRREPAGVDSLAHRKPAGQGCARSFRARSLPFCREWMCADATREVNNAALSRHCDRQRQWERLGSNYARWTIGRAQETQGDEWALCPRKTCWWCHCIFFHPPLSVAGGAISIWNACCLHAEFFQSTALNVHTTHAAGACSSLCDLLRVCVSVHFPISFLLVFSRFAAHVRVEYVCPARQLANWICRGAV